MRVTTLKAARSRLGGLLAYYAGLAEDRSRSSPGRGPVDYYLDPNEPAGRWVGRGRHALGLEGEVAPDELRALLEGRHPTTGDRLGRRFGDASARGFDATFSAPKSVSVLWALTPDPWVRAEVLAAHDTAVDAAIGWLETHGVVTRRGKDGVDQVDAVGLTVAVFRQHTSRTVDPQMHTHAVIAGKVQDTTGRWLSLDARFLKQQQRTIGWVYDAALRTELTARLGLGWGPIQGGQADATCIPDRVRDLFSQRSRQVEAKLSDLVRAWVADHDGADPSPRTIADLQRRAVLASRPGKDHALDPATLHRRWADQARHIGFDRQELTTDLLPGWSAAPALTDDELVVEALRRVEEESATWLSADLARHIATLLPPGAARHAAGLVAEIDRLTSVVEARCVGLGPPTDMGVPCRRDGRPVSEAVTDRRLSTERVLQQETQLLRWAESGTRSAERSTDPHAAAIDAMASDAPVVLVVGPAGAGKTTATATAVDRLRRQGRPVVALAPSGKAADVLATEAGCHAETLAAFLARHDASGRTGWPAGTTVVVDEAGMATTDDLHRLGSLANTYRWRVVAIGDPAQLPSVGRGGDFAYWTDRLPSHQLDTPRRFTEPWEATASLALRSGDPRAAQDYAAHGRLRPLHPAVVAAAAADLHDRHVAVGRRVAITASTAETARQVNREIQRRLHGAGGDRTGVALADGTHAVAGDRIATRRNDAALVTDAGRAVRNRHSWTVTATGADGSLTVTDGHRGTVTLPAGYVAQHVELGWAVTGYGSQGETVDVGIAVLEQGTSRNQAYVAMTRGRHGNLALLPDPTGVADAADLLATMCQAPSRQRSALATAAELHDRAGVAWAPPTLTSPPAPAVPERDPVAAIQARLDRLQRVDRGHGRGLSR